MGGTVSAARILVGTTAVLIAALTFLATPSFGVDGDPATFDPQVSFETSTTRATAHPDARITIDNTGNTANIRSMKMSLPNGFWGSLRAVSAKCSSFVAGAGATGSDTCTGANEVGTVTSTAKIVNSDGKISDGTMLGDVFLVDSADPADAAGIGIRVHAQVGGVDLGYVRVLGHARLRGNAAGMDTIVENIPTSITDTHSRTVSFHIERMTVDLVSDLDGPYKPLLTNPSTCGTSNMTAVMSPNATLGGPGEVTGSNPYTVTGCNTVRFSPTTFSFDPVNHAAGALTGFTNEIDFPDDSASINRVDVKLPQAYGPNMPAFGAPADQCPSSSAPLSTSVFDPSGCPSPPGNPGHPELGSAVMGTITLTTPLLSGTITGNVYLINKTPLPWLGVDINPSIPGNPPGVTLRMTGVTSMPYLDPTCGPGGESFCQQVVQASFVNLPDAPMTSATLNMNRPDRANHDATGTLSGKFLTNDVACQPTDDVTATFTSNSNSIATPSRAYRIYPNALTGCPSDPLTISSGPIGSSTSDTTPTFGFDTGAFYCGVDAFSYAVPGMGCSTGGFTYDSSYVNFEWDFKCTNDGYDPPSAPASNPCPYPSPNPSGVLGNGFHRFFVGPSANRDSNSDTSRAFLVQSAAAAADTTPPTTTIDSGPVGSTADQTPDFTFSGTDDVTASGSLSFQCSVDSGAFLPCSSSHPTGSFYAGSSHTFAVRAQDAAGNVDLTPATASFTIDVPFAPTLTVTSSTNVARAHPNIDIEIDNLSHQDIKDVTVKLPDGLLGGLQGVGSLCDTALAAAGNCPASSKVGTIDTEALVDQSLMRISGDVFITAPYEAGDPAGLSIKVPVTIQDVNMGNIIVPARLKMRGEAQGLDTMVLNVPDHVTPDPLVDPWDSTTYFDMHKMVMHMRTNPAATQPLMTNPSSCSTGSFEASFTGYGATTGSASVPYPVTGCDAVAFAPRLSAEVHMPDGSAPDNSKFKIVDMSVKLTSNPDDAGIKNASVLLPKPLTMELQNMPAVCEQSQYEADACPSTTILGQASATSPLLAADDPPLQGPVYLVRGFHTSLPRLYVRLTGRITVRFIGTTAFENGDQILTKFTDLPDAPLTSFSMTINGLMKTQQNPCDRGEQFGFSMTGTLTGHNDKTASVDSPLVFNCADVAYKYAFKNAGKRTKLNLALQTKSGHAKFKSVKLKLPKGLTFVKKAIKSKLSILVDGKRLKPKCVKLVKPGLLTSNLCGVTADKIEFKFKPGSLNAAKKLRRGNITVTTVGVDGKSNVDKLNIFSKAFRTFAAP